MSNQAVEIQFDNHPRPAWHTYLTPGGISGALATLEGRAWLPARPLDPYGTPTRQQFLNPSRIRALREAHEEPEPLELEEQES